MLFRSLLTAALHLLQPIARLRGRLKEGLTPWRRHGTVRRAPLWTVTTAIWSERWASQDERLLFLERLLRAEHACVLCGDAHDGWDLEVRGGILGAARLLVGVEDHHGGKQMIRVRWWPKIPVRGPFLTLALGAAAAVAAHAHAWLAVAAPGIGAVLPLVQIVEQCMAAMATLQRAVGDRKSVV